MLCVKCGVRLLGKLKSDRTAGAGKLLNLPASSLCSQRKIRQLSTRRTASVFAQVRFVFWIRPASFNARFRSAKRIENCENAVVASFYGLLTATSCSAFPSSSWAFTFWRPAVRASICFCCLAMIASCFASVDFNSAIVASCSRTLRCSLRQRVNFPNGIVRLKH